MHKDMDEIVLNYHDSLLHKSDLELLNEGNWLNDRLIGFVYEYFEHDSGLGDNDAILFVNPSTVQYLKLCASLDEAKACILEPLEVDKKELVFFPLNNNSQASKAGGSHWSLLVLVRHVHNLIHFDSTGSNEREARSFYEKYKTCLKADKLVSDVTFPKQTNSSDCGVYLLAGTELIAKQLEANNKSVDFDFYQIDSDYIKEYREKCKNLIKSLRK